ncbi:MAG: hypothetical protein IH897_13205 [Planctomycetes bacterium]|nr:hypothetical protein [Planctomycetota bacterium]
MSESKSTCHLCKRVPGERHTKKCALGRRYRLSDALRKMRDAPYKRRHPIADIDDCVGGKMKTNAIPKGTPTRVQL